MSQNQPLRTLAFSGDQVVDAIIEYVRNRNLWPDYDRSKYLITATWDVWQDRATVTLKGEPLPEPKEVKGND